MESIDTVIKDTKIAIVTSIPFVLVTNLKQQIKYLHSAGMDITLISSDGPQLSKLELGNRLNHIVIRIERKPAPLRDLIALFRLIAVFRKRRFKIIHSTTPKAGLLTAIAARIAGVAIRIHTFTGQRWLTMSGLMGWIAKYSDRLIAKLNTYCYADSKSQVKFLVDEGITDSSRIGVLGSGSLAGIDVDRFDRKRFKKEFRDRKKEELGITEAIIIIFVGRLNHDKGISELLTAFSTLCNTRRVELLLVGPMELNDNDIDSRLKYEIQLNKHIHTTGYTDSPENYLAVADVLCIPSYREGFGTVVMEAASMGIPTVGTRINGLIDAVVEGKTGFLVPPHNGGELTKALEKLVDSQLLRQEMGKAALKRCRDEFDYRALNGKLVDEYERFLSSK